MSKWFSIMVQNDTISLIEIDSVHSSMSQHTIKWDYYKDSCTHKTKYFVLSQYTKGKETAIEINGWILSRRILAELRKWSSGIGKHSFYEINITSTSEGEKAFRFYAEYGESELLKSIIITLGMLFMCKSSRDFENLFSPLRNRGGIYDWRTKLSAELSWKLIHAIKKLDLNMPHCPC